MTKITEWQSAETMAETETELSESVEENKPQTSRSTTPKCSSRKFTGTAGLPRRHSQGFSEGGYSAAGQKSTF